MSEQFQDHRTEHTGEAGDKWANRMATGIATLVATSIMGIGTVVINDHALLSSMVERCGRTTAELDRLRSAIESFPSRDDIVRLRQRIDRIEDGPHHHKE